MPPLARILKYEHKQVQNSAKNEETLDNWNVDRRQAKFNGNASSAFTHTYIRHI